MYLITNMPYVTSLMLPLILWYITSNLNLKKTLKAFLKEKVLIVDPQMQI